MRHFDFVWKKRQVAAAWAKRPASYAALAAEGGAEQRQRQTGPALLAQHPSPTGLGNLIKQSGVDVTMGSTGTKYGNYIKFCLWSNVFMSWGLARTYVLAYSQTCISDHSFQIPRGSQMQSGTCSVPSDLFAPEDFLEDATCSTQSRLLSPIG